MIVETKNLTGAALDWAVAMAEGYTNLRFHREPPLAGAWVIDPPRKAYGPVLLSDCAFSTDWAQGGPIIEREGILFIGTGDGETYNAWICKPYAAGLGPTHLIAAMRCFVASKLGDTIDIPEELL